MSKVSYSSLADPSPKLTAALDTATWQSEFKANNERDQAEIIHYLSDIKNTQSIIAMTQHQQSTDIKAIMALMQQVRKPCRFLVPSQHTDPFRRISQPLPVMIPRVSVLTYIRYKSLLENFLRICIYIGGKYIDLANTPSVGQVPWISGRDYT